MAPTQDDGRVGSRIENYAGFWQKDINKEAKVDSDVRLENYTEVINGTTCPRHLSFIVHHLILSSSRLLRWSDGTLRVWLGQVIPLFALLQGRGIRRIVGPSRALPCLSDVPSSGHARSRRRLWRGRPC